MKALVQQKRFFNSHHVYEMSMFLQTKAQW